MSDFNWTCPVCQRAQTVSDRKRHFNDYGIYVGDNKLGRIGIRVIAIGCSNPECADVEIKVFIASDPSAAGNFEAKLIISKHPLRPESFSKPQPNYIPAMLVQDYVEACKIRDLSPKASATLARRCIQGMIRDFCKISKGRLIDEIVELGTRVEAGTAPAGVTGESVEAIDHVRKIGNIGAHMEKDIDVIVDVDPGEAQALIELIELLFDEWYVSRKTRQDKLAKVKLIAASKDESKKAPPSLGDGSAKT